MDTLKYHESNKAFNVFVASTFADLKRLKKENNKAAFNELLLKTLHQVRRYIVSRIGTALTKGNLPHGKYQPDDFIDQLFIEVYDHFDDVKNERELHPWLFKKANELLEDTITDEEFDDHFLKNIDDYSKAEWDEMEENFSTDGGGDYVMVEELDDISYPKNDYVLNHVFIEDSKQKLQDKLDRELDEEDLRRHVKMVLHNLPLPMRTVFELATEYEFTLGEIAEIQNESLDQVRQLFDNAKKSIELSFFNRYTIDK
tara:strand:+ start:6719 stop:7489 length:771 start_codon:yes stop_codon:yes gene_type:complete